MKFVSCLIKIVLVVVIFVVFVGVVYVEIVKIVIVGFLIGVVVQYGDMVKVGVFIVIEQINVVGGVNGNKFEVVMMDDVCEFKQVVVVVNKIVSQGIKYVIGYVCFGFIIFVFDIYENEGVVMIIFLVIVLQLIEVKLYKFIFCIIGCDDQ